MTDLRTWEAWHNVHQPWELDWWKTAIAAGHFNSISSEWTAIIEFVSAFGRVLDVGSGPKPMFAPCSVIEPLAPAYQALVPPEWWQDVAVYARPAEQRLEQLVGKFDVVVCWNCLDHAVGWREILKNISEYGAPSARYYVAVDFHAPFLGHPGFGRDEFASELHKYFAVIEQREPLGRQLAMRLTRRTDA